MGALCVLLLLWSSVVVAFRAPAATRGPGSGAPLSHRRHRFNKINPFMVERSSFGESSSIVKGIVGGLTSIVNLVSGERISDQPRVYKNNRLRPQQLKALIKGDFDRGYLFSGDIDPEVYTEDCSFTDPTISFTGLSTFERNIAALKPILDRFVGERGVDLRTLELDTKQQDVTAAWRMSGEVRLPWNPRIELTGQTVFHYEGDSGRVVSYTETWDLGAGAVLLQLLYPGKKAEP
ncbi:hypothetical protein B484DRAFT_449940, partial [Ochromonadaceae sp. CCMP2298]|mmetsp:Transcript_3598/g.7775  ORF Transcript_3598/g.7775 Transcript_3598/m.7775 type:complete len:235 (+) Transcript_3598:2-706(+)